MGRQEYLPISSCLASLPIDGLSIERLFEDTVVATQRVLVTFEKAGNAVAEEHPGNPSLP